MYCRNCGEEINEKAEICVHCGVRPLAERKFCQECGAETKPNQELCTKCGVRLKTFLDYLSTIKMNSRKYMNLVNYTKVSGIGRLFSLVQFGH
jgi:uncharacterized membrane protein YvbJ